MKIWNQAPLIRLILPLLGGIIIAILAPSFHTVFLTIAIVFTAASMILGQIRSLHTTYKRLWRYGILLNVSFITLGYQLVIAHTDAFRSDHFSQALSGQKLYVCARVSEPVITKPKSLKVTLSVRVIGVPGKMQNATGKLLAYFEKDSEALNVRYGDEVVFCTTIKTVPPPQNPGEFDYRSFLAFHNIGHQVYLPKGSWKMTSRKSTNPILQTSYALRDHLLGSLSNHGVAGDEFAVGAALLLGYEDKLEGDVISAYSRTGALHILSVSGLHVAIIYVVFNSFLFFLDRLKYGHVLKAIVLILLLWMYAAVTGLSPSVLRAATMFSFIIVAKAFRWHANIYNTLAASAFLLLLINPFLAVSAGFQLSYLAVAGIVYIHPLLYATMDLRNRLLDQLWQITSVSIAAQIATFPLGLFYFHQFPNYFLISNIIVIPLSTLVIYLGIAVLATSAVPVICTCLARGFSFCIRLLNGIVQHIEKWPFAVLDDLSIAAWEMVLIYGIIILIFIFIASKKLRYLFLLLTATVALLAYQAVEQHRELNQRRVLIYSIPKSSVIGFVAGKKEVLFSDPVAATNEAMLNFKIKPHRATMGITSTIIITQNGYSKDLWIHNGAIKFGHLRIMQLTKKNRIKAALQPLRLDILIISDNPDVNIRQVLGAYDPALIIFDSSNSGFRIKRWSDECRDQRRSFYSVPDNGAYQLNL